MPIIRTTKPLKPRNEFDYYPTPIEFVEAALNFVTYTPTKILDPGAGDGIWGKVAREKWPNAIIYGVEVQPKFTKPNCYDQWFNEDFLNWEANTTFDLIIGNPPYGKPIRDAAEFFTRKCYSYLEDERLLVFLLRLAFLEGQDRGKYFWPNYSPKKVTVCSKRPSFTGNGKTDATAYGIYQWEKGWQGDTKLSWLMMK